MVPDIWSATDRILCNFGPFFLFNLTNKPKNQKFENMKKCWDYHHYHHFSVSKIMIICFTVLEIWRDGCNCYFSFWAVFALQEPPFPLPST